MRYSYTIFPFFFSSRRRHTRYWRDWSSDVCSSDLPHDKTRTSTSGNIEERRERAYHEDAGTGESGRGGTGHAGKGTSIRLAIKPKWPLIVGQKKRRRSVSFAPAPLKRCRPASSSSRHPSTDSTGPEIEPFVSAIGSM